MNQPNIVFILIDDMGWKDVACCGSEFYETPNLDRLAREGMRFTHAYASCPVCSPTRASVLTGKYPATVGITDWIDWAGRTHPARGRLIDVPYLRELPRTEHTLASTLRASGYATWHVGKWHLGSEGSLPEDHGFDVNIGGGGNGGTGPGGFFSPWTIPALEGVDVPEGTELTDYLTDQAVSLIHNERDSPYFLSLWHYAVHTPIQASAELVQKYERKAKELGLDKLDAFEEGEHFPTEHKRNQRVRRRLVQSDPVYAAMVENLDANIGRVLEALEETGDAANTIVVFTSDNGGLATAEGSPTCNLPLAEGKGWMYEGGTRVPLFVRWPGQTRPGAECAVPVTTPDFYPTLLEAAGIEPMPQRHVDGVSLMPLLKGARDLAREAIFWHYPHYGNQGGTPAAAVRRGDYKLIRFFEDGRLELYNLVDDPGERHNLAQNRPGLTAELDALLRAWQGRVEAKLPELNPDWREAE